MATKLVDILFPYAEEGFDIVVTCPSCGLALRQEYPTLLDNAEAKLLSEKTHIWSQYLVALGEKGELDTEFTSATLSVAYHASCHLQVQAATQDTTHMLSMVPQLSLTELNRGCCGMCGTFGMHARSYQVSAHIGEALIERIEELNPQIVATDCGACLMQITQHTNVRVIHPVRLLYGNH